MYALLIGLIFLLPAITVAQEKKEAAASQSPPITPAKTIDSKEGLTELQPNLKITSPENKQIPEGKSGLYHIVVINEDQKKQSIWVEVDRGEQKYITIKLDNGSSEDVLIQLENQAPALKTLLRSRNGLSSLTLQPISF